MSWPIRTTSANGTICVTVKFRPGGAKAAKPESDTFSSGTSEENESNAQHFMRLVKDAGERWPQGWERGCCSKRSRRAAPTVVAPVVHVVHTIESVGRACYDQTTDDDAEPDHRSRSKRQISKLYDLTLIVKGEPVRPFCKPIEDITPDDVRLWMREWRETKSRGNRMIAPGKKTISNYHGTLHRVFEYAIEKGIIDRNPCASTAIRRKTVIQHQARRQMVQRDDIPVYLQYADDTLLSFLFLDVLTGVRMGELTAFMVVDVSYKEWLITVDRAWKKKGELRADGTRETAIPKIIAEYTGDPATGRFDRPSHWLGFPKSAAGVRRIPFGEKALPFLRKLTDGKGPYEFLLAREDGASWSSADFYRYVMEPYRERLTAAHPEMRGFTMQELRHSFNTWLGETGLALQSQRQVMGHGSDAMTGHYSHITPEARTSVLHAIDGVTDDFVQKFAGATFAIGAETAS